MNGGKLILATLMAVLIGCQSDKPEGPTDEKGRIEEIQKGLDFHGLIYGVDDREEIGEVQSSMKAQLARSTVAFIEGDTLSVRGDQVRLQNLTLQQKIGVCSEEPHSQQIAASGCSGALVGKDLVLTAGHCVPNNFWCARLRMVFDFALNEDGTSPVSLPTTKVYRCAEIVHTEQDSFGADIALIRLDREVTDRQPLKIRREGKVNQEDKVFTIGHPSGVPTKITSNGDIRGVSEAYFTTNLDTYGGNSGSAVFNEATGLIEGVLVRGGQDYIMTPQGCLLSNHCEEDECRGEDVTHISKIWPHLPEQPVIDDPVIDDPVIDDPVVDDPVVDDPVVDDPVVDDPVVDDPVVDDPVEIVKYEANPSLPIPDNHNGGMIHTLSIPKGPNGRKVVVRVDIAHTWVGDLGLALIAPNGTVVILKFREGSKQVDLQAGFGDETTSYQSMSPLSDVSEGGQWTLFVADYAERDQGTLKSWSIEFH